MNDGKRKENIRILEDTINCIREEHYVLPGTDSKGERQRDIALSPDEICECRIYYPEDIKKLKKETELYKGSKIPCSVVNQDSFDAAMQMDEDKKVLVLNMANPLHPGGGVRYGADGQEEDLCRRSTLLISLESNEAWPYYVYNKSFAATQEKKQARYRMALEKWIKNGEISGREPKKAKDYSDMGDNTIVINPNVFIFKNYAGEYIDPGKTVSVITCGAPDLKHGTRDISYGEYKNIYKDRVLSVLLAAKDAGYKDLVLGAFGCGAYRNDAMLAAKAFKEGIDKFGNEDFNSITFAVLDKTQSQYNFEAFKNTFIRNA